MIQIALHIPPAAEFSQFTTQVNFNSISTLSAFATTPIEPAQAHNHNAEHSNSCAITPVERKMTSIESGMPSDKRGMTSVESGMASDKRGMPSDKRGMTSVKRGMTSVESGMASVKSGITSVESGMTSVKHGITINLSDF